MEKEGEASDASSSSVAEPLAPLRGPLIPLIEPPAPVASPLVQLSKLTAEDRASIGNEIVAVLPRTFEGVLINHDKTEVDLEVAVTKNPREFDFQRAVTCGFCGNCNQTEAPPGAKCLRWTRGSSEGSFNIVPLCRSKQINNPDEIDVLALTKEERKEKAKKIPKADIRQRIVFTIYGHDGQPLAKLNSVSFDVKASRRAPASSTAKRPREGIVDDAEESARRTRISPDGQRPMYSLVDEKGQPINYQISQSTFEKNKHLFSPTPIIERMEGIQEGGHEEQVRLEPHTRIDTDLNHDEQLFQYMMEGVEEDYLQLDEH